MARRVSLMYGAAVALAVAVMASGRGAADQVSPRPLLSDGSGLPVGPFELDLR